MRRPAQVRLLPRAYLLFETLFTLRDRLTALLGRGRRRPRPGARLGLEAMEARLVPDGRPLPLPVLFLGTGQGPPPIVRGVDAVTGDTTFTRTVFDPAFTGGVRVAAGDFNSDGYPDIVAGAGPGGGPVVTLLDGKSGAPIRTFFAFDPGFTGGVTVAAVDVTGDGVPDIVAAAGAGGGPEVAVFDGRTGALVESFFAFDPAFTGGVTIAAATNLTGDGHPDLVVGAGVGGGPRVRVFDLTTGTPVAGPLGSFFAFDPATRSGVTVGTDTLAGDVTGDGIPDLVVGTGPGVASEVKVFSGADGSVVRDFAPFGPGMTAGVTVATAYVDDDPNADVIVGTGPGIPAEVKIFSGATGQLVALPTADFRPFGADATGGVNLAASNDPPVPAVTFGVTPANPTAGQAVTASGSVTSTQAMASVGLSADWGDGTGPVTTGFAQTWTSSTAVSFVAPKHVYSSAGSYTVTVTATASYAGASGGSGGGSATGTATSLVTVTGTGASGGSGGTAAVWVSPGSLAVAEGGSGDVWVYRSGGDTTQPLTVNLGLGADGTGDPLAAWNTDYTLTAGSGGSVSLGGSGGTVTFGAYQTGVFLTVAARTDAFVEGTEGFRVTVQLGTGYTPGSGGAGGSTTADVRLTDVPPVALTAAPSPAAAGQPVTLTATIGPVPAGVAAPTGAVTFADAGVVLGTGVLGVSGTAVVATLTTTALGVGTHTLTAAYGGDGTYNPSTSPPLTETVSPAATTTTVTPSANPAAYGQPVTYTAAVTGPAGGGTPTGSVTFAVDGVNQVAVGLDAGGHATWTPTTPPGVGSHTITASYGGSSSFGSSSGSVGETVNSASTTTGVSTPGAPAVYGRAVTFTAAVTPGGPGLGTPTGTVTFADGSSVLGTATLSNGTATLTTAALGAGPHTVTATYGGDATFAGSSGSAGQVVAPAALTVTASPVAMTYADGTTLNGATGFTVAGLVGADRVGAVGLSTDAALSTSGNWAAGAAWTITPAGATGTGLSNYTITYRPGTLTVAPKGLTVTGFAAADKTYDGTTAAGVTADGALAGVVPGDAVGLDPAGRSAAFADPHAGPGKPVTAAGDALAGADARDYALAQPTTTATISPAGTTTGLTPAPTPAVFGQPVTLTATVGVVAPGAGTPTGTVTFADGAAVLGTAPLTAGVATFTTTALAVGTHTLTAAYAGGPDFTPATSPGVTAVVGPAPTAAVLAVAPNPSEAGEAVTLTATVGVVAPGAGTPTGTVTFADGAAVLGTAPLTAGVATFTTTALAAGPHSLSAGYGGDPDFAPATAPAVAATVVPPAAAAADAYTVVHDRVLAVPAPGVLGNDTAPLGRRLSAALVSGPAHGAVVLNPDGSFTYTPAAGSVGPDSFTYQAADGHVTAAPATVTVQVTDRAPVAAADAAATYAGFPVTIPVLANDADPDGDALSAVLGAGPANGTVVLNPDGTVTYTPAAGFVGTDTFTYQASDGIVLSAPATVTVTVHLSTLAGVVWEDVVGSGQRVPADPGVGGAAVVVVDAGGNPVGAATTAADGSYAVGGLAPGAYTVRFTAPGRYVFDGSNAAAWSTPITVVAGADSALAAGAYRPATVAGTVWEDVAGTGQQVPADPGVGGAAVVVVDAGGNPVGSATTATDGSYAVGGLAPGTYTVRFAAPAGYRFDGTNTTSWSAPVTMTSGADTGPSAGAYRPAAVAGTVWEDVTGSGQRVAADPGVGGAAVTVVDAGGTPVGSTTTAADGSYVIPGLIPGAYTARFAAPGGYVFDGTTTTAWSAPVTVTSGAGVGVGAGAYRPATVAGTVWTDLAGTGQRVAADPGVGGAAVTVVDAGGTPVGTATTGADGGYTVGGLAPGTYTVRVAPPHGYKPGTPGSGTPTVTLTSGQAGTGVDPALLPTPWVPDTTPAAVHAGGSVVVNVLAGAIDPDGDVLAVTAVTQPVEGTVARNADGTLTYTAPADRTFTGPDPFTYTITDATGQTATGTVTVTVWPPLAVSGVWASTHAGVPVPVPLLAAAADPDGDALTLAGYTQPAHGTLAPGTDPYAPGVLVYTPTDPAFVGHDSFTYTVTDGNSGSATATASLDVTAPITAGAVSVTAAPGTAVTVDVLAHAADPDGDTLTLAGYTQPAHGTLAPSTDPGAPPGTLVYTAADPTFVGTDSFTYSVADGHGGTATGTVTVTMTAAPTATDVAVATPVGVAATVNVLGSASDPVGHPLTVTGYTQPAHGAVAPSTAPAAPAGALVYTPAAGYAGPDAFTYTVGDGVGGTATAAVTVTVESPVTAADQAATTPAGAPVTVNLLAGATDAAGGTLAAVLDAPPAHGTVVLNPDGTITYTPAAGYVGPDPFTYQATDGVVSSATASVGITVWAPLAVSATAGPVSSPAQPVTFTGTASGGIGGFTWAWEFGDGETSSDPNPTHTYAAPGPYTASVTVTDGAGHSQSATVGLHVPGPLTVTAPTGLTEGQVSQGPVATLTGQDPAATADEFTGTIDWGDGTTSAGTVTAVGGGAFAIAGAHSYPEEGAYTLSVAVTRADGTRFADAAPATVADAPVGLTALSVHAARGRAFAGQVAVLTDADPAARAGDDTVSVAWGDGTTTPGTVVPLGGGRFAVTGGHTYPAAGAYTLAVSADDGEGHRLDSAATTRVGALAAVEGAAFGVTIGTFTDPTATAGDLTATIDWGDGTTSPGTVAADTGGGSFPVGGNHTYAAAGGYPITAQVLKAGTPVGTVTAAIDVADAGLAALGVAVAGTEGQTVTAAVATFTHGSPVSVPGPFSAAIDWGDGTVSAGAVTTPADGLSTVTGTHTYAAAGAYPVAVTVLDADGGIATTTAAATIADAPLAATGIAVAATQGRAFAGPVATVTDADPGATADALTATVDWGDGTTSAGTIAPDPAGGFDVSGSHTYAVDGPHTVTATVSDAGGAQATATTTATVTAGLGLQAGPVTAVAGTAFAGLVGGFADPDPQAAAGDFTATVAWGDGTSSTVTVAADAGFAAPDPGGTGTTGSGFSAVGTHTYAVPGTFTVTLSVTDHMGATATATGTARVAALAATAGQPLAGTLVTFPDPAGTAGQTTGTIDWGDGATSAAAVADSNGQAAVSGSHPYAHAGFYPATVTLTGPGGPVTLTTSVAVADAPITASGTTVQTPGGGQRFAGPVAAFTSGNPLAAADSFTALVDWGDGTVSAGTVAADGRGGFVVTGETEYQGHGTYTVTVSISSADGSTATATTTAVVSPAGPALTALAPEALAGQPFTGPLAWFVDPDPAFGPAGYTTSIAWGGQTTPGTVGPNGADGLAVSGSFTFPAAGVFPVTVTLTRADGATSVQTVSFAVGDATLTGTGTSIAVAAGAAFAGPVGTFTDPNPAAAAGDFTAVIEWGDGSASTGTVTGAGGSFTVAGSHTYAAAGQYEAAVTVLGTGGGGVTFTSPVGVADVPPAVTVNATGLVEGVVFTGGVATFTSPDPDAAPADFTATIDWGDGTMSAGTVAEGQNGRFAVQGSHMYPAAGSATIVVEVTGTTGSKVSAQEQVAVLPFPTSIVIPPSPLTVDVGQPCSGTIATFTSPALSKTVNDFTARVTWNDATTSIGTIISLGSGMFGIEAPDKVFSTLGAHAVQLTVTEMDGGNTPIYTATTNTRVVVVVGNGVTVKPADGTLIATAGQPSSNRVLATFSDTNPAATADDFDVIVYWGDGSHTAVAPEPDGHGGFTVTAGQHVYTYAQAYTVGLTVREADLRHSVSTTESALVSAVPLSVTGIGFTRYPGAHFDDQRVAFVAVDSIFGYGALIDWGDGTQSTGTITASQGGGYVTGSHTYPTRTGAVAYTVTVLVTGGYTQAKATSTASIVEPTLASEPFKAYWRGGLDCEGIVAAFTDGPGILSDDPSDFTATIDWGDGTTSAGKIVLTYDFFHKNDYNIYTYDFSSINVAGSHRYPNPPIPMYQWMSASKEYTITVTITNTKDGRVCTSSRPLDVVCENQTVGLSATTVGTLSATAGVSFSTLLATFTAPEYVLNPDYLPIRTYYDSFPVSVDWGDVIPSGPGLTVSGGAGAPKSQTGIIYGSHTYAHSGTYVINLVIGYFGYTPATYTSGVRLDITVTVNDPPDADTTLTAIANTYSPGLPEPSPLVPITAMPINASVGQQFTGVVATAPNLGDNRSWTRYLIDWGDGSISSAASLSTAPDGTYLLTGSHIYTQAGRFSFCIMAIDLNAFYRARVIAVANVTGPTLPPWYWGPTVLGCEPLTEIEGVSAEQLLATFRLTPDPAEQEAGDETATINWGDGSPVDVVAINNDAADGQSGSVTTVSVRGGHAYKSTGSYLVQISLRTGRGTATASTTATVATQAWTATACPVPIHTPGYDYGPRDFSGWLLATIALSTGPTAATEFSAEVDWGAGYRTIADVVGGGNTLYVISPVANYLDPGVHDITVWIADGSGTVSSVTIVSTVADGRVGSLASVPVATCQTSSPGELLPYFMNNWGDGAAETSTVFRTVPDLVLGGQHVYAHAGTYAVTVTGKDLDEQIAATRTIRIADAPLAWINKVPVVNFEAGRQADLIPLGTFIDPDPLAAAGNFTATIDWGDGSTVGGVVTRNSDVTLIVSGSGHVYQSSGTYTVVVLVANTAGDSPGSLIAAALQAEVRKPDLAIQTADPIGISGQPDQNWVATLFNVRSSEISRYTADLTWTDSGFYPLHENARVVAGPGDTARIYSTHIFGQAGEFPISVQVQALGEVVLAARATEKVYSAPTLTGLQRTDDPTRADALALGEATVSPNTGAVSLSHPLDFDLSPGTAVGGSPALVYNSATVNVHPTLELDLVGQLPGTPLSGSVTITWAGQQLAPIAVTFPAGRAPAAGDGWRIEVPLPQQVTETGLYTWSASLQLTVSTALGVLPLSLQTAQYQAAVVVRDDPKRPDPFGTGWGIDGIDQIVDDPAGSVLWITGDGTSRVFKTNGTVVPDPQNPGAWIETFQSPAEDFGRLVRIISPTQLGDFVYTAKDTTRYTFDAAGHLLTVVNPQGIALTYQYDNQGRLTNVLAPDGGQTRIDYNGGQVLINEPGQNGPDPNRALVLTLGGTQLQTIRDVDFGQTLRRFGYGASVGGRLTVDNWGPLQSLFNYQPITPAGSPPAPIGTLRVSRGGILDDKTSSDTIVPATAIPTDGNGGLIAVPTLASVATDTNNLPSPVTGLSVTSTYTLDARGRELKYDRALNLDPVTQVIYEESYQRNAAGDVTLAVDARGRQTSYAYDNFGDVTGTTYLGGTSGGTSVSYKYDPTFHYLTEATDENKHTTTYAYDAIGEKIRTINPLGQVTTYTYYGNGVFGAPNVGLLKEVIEPRDPSTGATTAVTTFQYDLNRRLELTTDALGNQTVFWYDQAGNPQGTLDALGRRTLTAYDGRNQLVSATDANGHTVSYRYNSSGELTSTSEPKTVYDPNSPPGSPATQLISVVTSYVYDSRGWKTQVIKAVGRPEQTTSTFAYDLAGDLTGETTGISDYELYTDPNSGVVKLYRFPPAAGTQVGPYGHKATTTYAYDDLGRRTGMTEAAGTADARRTSYAYDLVGNLVSETTGQSVYDPKLSNVSVTRYAYDRRDRRTAVYENWKPIIALGWQIGGTYDRLTTTEYDDAGNVRWVTTGMSTNLFSHISTTSYAYDALDRVTDVYQAYGTPDQVQTHTVYDVAGNVTDVTTGISNNPAYDHESTTHYTYDLLDRKTGVFAGYNNWCYDAGTTMVYDAVGNLLSETTGLARNTEPPHESVTSYAYDKLNRRTDTYENWQPRTVLGVPIGTTFDQHTKVAYDQLGHVIQVATGLSTNLQQNPEVTGTFYDALGRAVEVIQSPGQVNQVQTSTRYDAADNLIWERTGQGTGPGAPGYYSHPSVTTFAYDALGRQVGKTLAAGTIGAEQSQLIYDAADDLLTQIRFRAPQDRANSAVLPSVVTSYAYDALGDRTQTIEGLSYVPQLVTLPESRTTSTTYDAAGNPVLVTTGIAIGTVPGTNYTIPYAKPVTTAYEYDTLGRVVRVYEDWKLPTPPARLAAAAGVAGVASALAQVSGAYGRVTTTRYDAAGDVLSVTKPAPDWYPNGVTTSYAYDALGRPTEMIQAYQVANQAQTTQYKYDGAGNVIEVTDPRGVITKTSYTAEDQPETITQAVGQLDQVQTKTVYDANGQVIQRMTGIASPLAGYDANGKLDTRNPVPYAHEETTRYTYDSLGRLSNVFDAWGHPEQRRTQRLYDAAGELAFRIAGLASDVTVSGTTNAPVFSVTPSAQSPEMYFNSTGQLVPGDPVLNLLGDPNKPTPYSNPGITIFSYDPLGRVAAETDVLSVSKDGTQLGMASRRLITTTYDGYDDPLSRTTTTGAAPGPGTLPVSVTSTFAYDAYGRLLSTTQTGAKLNQAGTGWDPAGQVLTQTTLYDAADNPVYAADGAGDVTTTTYDAFHDPLRVTDPEGRATVTEYDRAGDVRAVTDPGKLVTRYAYDALGELRVVTDSLGAQTVYDYTTGRLTKVTNPTGTRRVIRYDDLGRETGEDWLNGTGTKTSVLTYAYDATGDLLTALKQDNLQRPSPDPVLVDAYQYNALGQITRADQPFGGVLTYAYDAAGNRIRTLRGVNGAEVGRVDYRYDAAGRLTQETFRAGADQASTEAAVPTTVAIAYTDMDQVSRTSFSTPSGFWSTAYDYDGAGRLTTMRSTGGGLRLLVGTFSYDGAGRLTTRSMALATPDGKAWLPPVKTVYGYDKAGQLTSDGKPVTYGYDANGNPRMIGTLKVVMKYNSNEVEKLQDPRTNADAVEYQYDRSGNRTIQVTSGPGGSTGTIYAYDPLGRLVGVTGISPGFSPDLPNLTEWITYDAVGNRVKVQGSDRATPLAGNGTVSLYDGGTIWADLTVENNAIRTQYILGPGSGQRFGYVTYAAGQAAAPNWYLTDQSGTVLATLDASGRQQAEAPTPDTFGKVADPAALVGPNRFLYTGREADSLTGLQYSDGRYYDPGLQRYIDGNPSGSGGKNPYVYAENSWPNAGPAQAPAAPASPWDDAMKPTGTDMAGSLAAGMAELFGGNQAEARKIGGGLWGIGQFFIPGYNLFAIAETFAPRDTATGTLALDGGTNRFFHGARMNYDGYVANGFSPSDALGMTIQTSMPGAGTVIRAVEMAYGTSIQGTSYGQSFTSADYVLNAAGILGDVAGIYLGGAGIAGRVLGSASTAGRLARIGSGLRTAAEIGSYVSGIPNPWQVGAMGFGVAQRGLNFGIHGLLGNSSWHGPLANFANRLGFNVCFAAGTPLRTPDGSKPIEQVRVGDLVLSRDEHDPAGPVVAKMVEEVFVREGLVWHLHVGGQVIRTTAEHPFYESQKGWVACHDLAVGDLVLCEDGQWAAVEDLLDTGVWETVYNLRIADFHTYFVGGDEWGFSVWAHNSYGEFERIVTNENLKNKLTSTEARLAYFIDAKNGKAVLEQALQAEGLHPATIKKAVAVAEADGLFGGGVTELEVGPYGPLAARSVGDGLTPDHSPSFAAIRTDVERGLGRQLTPLEAAQLRDATNTIMIKTSSHMAASRSFGGRNTPAQINSDSLNLPGALQLDRAALNSQLLQDGHSQAAIDAAYRRLDQLNRRDGWY